MDTRANLFHAPDHPTPEDLPGTLAEREKLPPRFHVPWFDADGRPNSWLCAVCWDEGVVTSWPCKAARENGREVFQVHEPAGHPQAAVALARAVLAAAGDTGHEVARTDEIDATRARNARGFELTCEVRKLTEERDELKALVPQWDSLRAMANAAARPDQAMGEDIHVNTASGVTPCGEGPWDVARSINVDEVTCLDCLRAQARFAEAAAESMRDRAADAAKTAVVVDRELSLLEQRATIVAAIRALPLLPDDLTPVAVCPAFTADPSHPGTTLCCEHPAGEGHTGRHYADTWVWDSAVEPGAAPAEPARREVPAPDAIANHLDTVAQHLSTPAATDGTAPLCLGRSPAMPHYSYMCEKDTGHTGDHAALRGAVTWAATLAEPTPCKVCGRTPADQEAGPDGRCRHTPATRLGKPAGGDQ